MTRLQPTDAELEALAFVIANLRDHPDRPTSRTFANVIADAGWRFMPDERVTDDTDQQNADRYADQTFIESALAPENEALAFAAAAAWIAAVQHERSTRQVPSEAVLGRLRHLLDRANTTLALDSHRLETTKRRSALVPALTEALTMLLRTVEDHA